MEMIHRKLKQKHTSFAVSFMINKKFYLKILINVLFLADSINFYTNIESEVLRFSRPLRPCINPYPSFIFIIFFLSVMAFFYSKEMRRTLKGILKSVKQMFDLFIFYFFLILVWAGIGFLIINDLDGEYKYDEV